MKYFLPGVRQFRFHIEKLSVSQFQEVLDQQSFIQEGSAPGSNPLFFFIK